MGLSQKGLHDWIIQRASAVIMTAYILFLTGFFCTHTQLDYAAWLGLFTSVPMQVATMMVLLALMWHAWIGMWAVFTDYIKCGVMRVTLEAIVLLALLTYFFWGVYILWSI
jgi:succinate dehydrogenase / fumarate reductase membrane anchor subunit